MGKTWLGSCMCKKDLWPKLTNAPPAPTTSAATPTLEQDAAAAAAARMGLAGAELRMGDRILGRACAVGIHPSSLFRLPPSLLRHYDAQDRTTTNTGSCNTGSTFNSGTGAGPALL